MAEGLQVYNESGILQIDGNLPNVRLIQKGSAPQSELGYINNTMGRFHVDISCPHPPLVFLRSGNYNLTQGDVCSAALVTHQGGNTWRARWFGINSTYYAFGMVSAPNSGFGLEVFNASGAKVFNSSEKPLNIVYTGTSGVSNLPSSTYAVMATGKWGTFQGMQGVGLLFLYKGWKTTSRGFNIQDGWDNFGGSSGNTTPDWGSNPGIRYYVADVSGY